MELKVSSGRSRLKDLEHSLAAAPLMSLRHTADIRGGKGGPVEALAAVGAPRMSKSMVRKLNAFADRYLIDVAWCIVDASGVRPVRGLDLEVVEEGGALHRDPQVSSSTPFSDLGQWLLKVLLAVELDPR